MLFSVWLKAAKLRHVPINTCHVMTTLFNWSSLSEPWQPKWKQNTTALTTLPQGWVFACKHDSNHYDVDRIFAGLSWELHCQWQLDCALEWWRNDGRTKGLITPPSGWVSTLLYTFASVHIIHDGVVRMFIDLSCELGGLLYMWPAILKPTICNFFRNSRFWYGSTQNLP